jgi:site-specific recombinase XerD
VKQALQKNGIKKTTTTLAQTQLRNSFIRSGTDLQYIQELLGQ